MAITLDQPLGSASASTTSVSITTSQPAAAGSRVVVQVSWFNGTAGMTCSVGGTGATKDKQIDNGSDHFAIFSLVVAGGLASSSTITVTQDGGPGGLLVAAVSYLGTTGVDTNASTNTGTTAAAWSTGAAANTIADALFVGGAGTDGTIASESSTPGVGNERFDLFLGAANQGMVMQDLIVSSIASTALTGTWGTTTGLTTQTMALVIYKGTAAASAPLPQPHLPLMAPQGMLPG